MKKIKLTLCCVCFISTLTFAQTERKHHFGLGLSTDLFSGEVDFDNFKMHTFEYDDICIFENLPMVKLYLHRAIFIGMSFEYEYNFAKRWSVATRLKYNFRDQFYHYEFSDYSAVEDKRVSSMAGLVVTLNDLEVPLLLNYKIPMAQNTLFVVQLGAGLSFNVSKTVPNFDGKVYAVSVIDRTYHIDFEVLKTTTYFLNFGIAFESVFNNHKLQTRLSYTMYPEGLYKWNHYITGNDISTELYMNPFSQNNIEVGLAFFW
ncbi:MAG: PorT family protein [Bacteroidales bacterium]|nr:PorT family protein [Bacteroidales bacterium]